MTQKQPFKFRELQREIELLQIWIKWRKKVDKKNGNANTTLYTELSDDYAQGCIMSSFF